MAFRNPSKTDSPRQPKLMVFNNKGEYVSEYIPTSKYIYSYWLREGYLKARDFFGKDIYYWHTRHHYNPIARKLGDIEFIRHVMDDHNDEPTIPLEKRHYNRAWRLYGHEIRFIGEELVKDTDKDLKNEIVDGHPYAYAYTRQWFTDLQAEEKMLYHGIALIQYYELRVLLNDRAQANMDEINKKYGLDPKTGKKLKSKKRKKSKKTQRQKKT